MRNGDAGIVVTGCHHPPGRTVLPPRQELLHSKSGPALPRTAQRVGPTGDASIFRVPPRDMPVTVPRALSAASHPP